MLKITHELKECSKGFYTEITIHNELLRETRYVSTKPSKKESIAESKGHELLREIKKAVEKVYLPGEVYRSNYGSIEILQYLGHGFIKAKSLEISNDHEDSRSKHYFDCEMAYLLGVIRK